MNPIVKWAGGKRRLVSELLAHLPPDAAERTHVEPFAGGAAFFLARDVRHGDLADLNARLIATYRAIQERPSDVADTLGLLAKNYLAADAEERARLYSLRRRQLNGIPVSGPNVLPVSTAALFLFLNRTCFNGLYRENNAGDFNVPHGRYKSPAFPTRDEILALSERLASVNLYRAGFRQVPFYTRDAFVYCDPPYDGTFTQYQAMGFTEGDQAALESRAWQWAEAGAAVMVSNADTPRIRALYADWHIHEIKAPRTIAAKGTSRAPVTELLITSYKV